MLSWVGRDADAYFNNYALRARMPPGGHLPPDQPVPGTAAGDAGCPTVVTVLDLLSVTLRRDPHLRMPESPLDPLMDAIALRSLRRADAIIAISHYSKEVAVREARLPPHWCR